MIVGFLKSDTLIRIGNILREKGDLDIVYLCSGNNEALNSYFVCLFVFIILVR